MITFFGDAGIDHYVELDKKLLGGCALNVATHFKRNSTAKAQLIYPASSADREIVSHCLREDIHALALMRPNELPCQLITMTASGEKNFLKYQPGVIDGFKFTNKEAELIKEIKGTIVAPLFSQLMPIIDQVLTLNTHATYYFDFHDCSDFDYDFDRIRPYLERASLAQFGLSQRHHSLKEKLLNTNKDLIITQGSDEIIYKSNTKLHSFTPIKLDQVIDSTGAGDAFFGAFIATSSLVHAATYAASILKKVGSL